MVATKRASLTTALDIEQFHELAPKLGGLPDSASFQKRVEDDLWQTITGDAEYTDDSIKYNALPDRSKAVIGYAAEDKIPWWLQSFAWSATSHGETITLEKTNTEDTLAQFEAFDPQNTMIHKPRLQAETNDTEEGIVSVLEAFKDLYDALPDEVKAETEISEDGLPDQIFEIDEGAVRTTKAFEDWFQLVLQFSPPLNDTLTALLMTDVGVERTGVENILSDTLIDCLDEVGFGGSEVSNRDYRTSLRSIAALNGVFDLEVPQARKYDYLGGLEALFYETWAQNFVGDQESAAEWIGKASEYRPDDLEPGRQGAFVESVFGLPVRLEMGQVSYTTLRVTTNESRYYKSDQRKRKEINAIMEENGFLE